MSTTQKPTDTNKETPLKSDIQLNKLLLRKEELKPLYKSSLARRDRILPVGLLVVILMPIYTLMLSQIGGGNIAELVSRSLGFQITVFQILAALFTISLLLMFIMWLPLRSSSRNIEKELASIDNEIEEIYQLSSNLRLTFFQKQFLHLSSKSGRINWIDKERREQSEKLRLSVGNILSRLEELQVSSKAVKVQPGEVLPDWDDAQFALTQWDELLNDEERELQGERNWKMMSIGIAFAYLILLFLAIPLFRDENKTYDVFGIPFSIIVWGGLGSFAAILYKFYKSPRRVNFEIEFRWLIARPIIGTIMGALAYLALVSGSLIFNVTTSETTPAVDLQKSGQLAQFWIVAFLAGFSDKFYEKIIELLVGKFGTGKENDSESYVEKTESKVEITREKTENS